MRAFGPCQRDDAVRNRRQEPSQLALNALLLGLPVVGRNVCALGGALMEHRPRRITGFILALPPLALLGCR